jgi:sugar-specific transcriptional regulator TrmB
MPSSTLKVIGFTDSDTTVYELLIKEGECNKEKILKKTGLTRTQLEHTLPRLTSYGAIEVTKGIIAPIPPKTFLQKYLKMKEIDLELQMAEMRRNVNELQSLLEPVYSESRYGVRLEELWQAIEGLPSMEMETIRMISRCKSEVCTLAERMSYYPKVREELLSALDRKVKVRVLLLALDKETEERVEDMKRCRIEVRLARCEWRSMRFTLADKSELLFLIWAKKSDDSRVYYRPGYTKNPGMVSVFADSFEYLWEKAIAL